MEAEREAVRVLVTGASGYIGGRLVPRLLDEGYHVRCLARSPRKLEHRPWAGREQLEVVAGDAELTEDLERAMRGCRVAYYLIHSMITAGAEYAARDRALARSFAEAAARSSIERIVYLGGLGETGPGLSEHLASRREVERALAESDVPVTVFRAAMIIGSGSASFEILRYLVERLPVMVTPKWVDTRCQPLAIRNVLSYLVGCLRTPETIGRTLDIGGPEIQSYRDMMRTMAAARGLPRRWVLPLPVLTPRLSSLWIHLVTPIGKEIARPLAEGLRNEVVCRDGTAHELMPQTLLTIREAIDRALANVRDKSVETSWSDAGPMPGDPDWSGGSTFVDRWGVVVNAPREAVFEAVCRVGGGHGWYAADWLWRLRGWMDRLIGGPGLRRGRRSPEKVGYGEALDFWRVTSLEAPERLTLHAEMRLPGVAQLSFEVRAVEGDQSELVQTARFIPRGLLGLAYWYAVLPLHGVVFRGMLDGIRRSAEGEGERPGAAAPIRRMPPPPAA